MSLRFSSFFQLHSISLFRKQKTAKRKREREIGRQRQKKEKRRHWLHNIKVSKFGNKMGAGLKGTTAPRFSKSSSGNTNGGGAYASHASGTIICCSVTPSEGAARGRGAALGASALTGNRVDSAGRLRRVEESGEGRPEHGGPDSSVPRAQRGGCRSQPQTCGLLQRRRARAGCRPARQVTAGPPLPGTEGLPCCPESARSLRAGRGRAADSRARGHGPSRAQGFGDAARLPCRFGSPKTYCVGEQAGVTGATHPSE